MYACVLFPHQAIADKEGLLEDFFAHPKTKREGREHKTHSPHFLKAITQITLGKLGYFCVAMEA